MVFKTMCVVTQLVEAAEDGPRTLLKLKKIHKLLYKEGWSAINKKGVILNYAKD